MSKRSLIVFFILVFLLVSFSTAITAANLNSVSYSISGDSSDIDTLELEPEFMINNIHPAKLNFSFDGDDFYLAGDLALNMIRQNNIKMYLHLMLSNDIDGHNFGKAVGISGTTRSNLSFFWQAYYFIDDDLDDHVYYKGGINLAIAPRTSFEISLANQYWDLSDDVLKLGIKIDL